MAIPRREPPAALSVPRRESTANGLSADRPPIAALFLIEFDVKAGYTIVWKRVSPGLDVSGAVEYKSLPSGLHAVSEDLIYFVHEDNNKSSAAAAAAADHASDETPEEDATHSGGYAGLSAFVNLPTDEAGARFARMIAAGVLVPRSYGRLGRAWRHAGALLDIARKLAANRDELSILEAYWDEHNGLPRATSDADELVVDRPLLQINDSPQISPAVPSATFSGRTGYAGGDGGRQSASDGTAPLLVPPENRLSPYHPAWSLTSLLDTFGPLIFPIYRAALLRKRILISTHAPVREVNNFVYNISVLANIPISAVDVLEPTAASRQRIRPLFTVGVNDIPFLLADYAAFSKRATTAAGQSSPYNGPGWIACTTDSILAMKGELWDVLVTMPPSGRAARASKDKAWPTVEVAKGVPLKATQRDLRRFRALATGLNRLANRTTSPDDDLRRSTGAVTAEPRPSTTSSSSPAAAAATTKQNRAKLFHMDDTQLVDAADAIVEPVTWAALAYNGFMWWASAGEQRRSDETEEDIYDASLLADIVPPKPGSPTLRHHHHHHHHHQPYYQQQQPTTATSPLHDSLSSLKARRVSASGARIASAGNAEAAEDDDIEEEEEEEEERAQIELAIITYFHRLTTQLLSVFAEVIESNDDSDGGGGAYDADDGIDGDDESGEEDRDGRYFDDDDDDDDNGYDDYDDDRGDGGIGVAHGTGARRDNVVVAGGRSAPGRGADDGLVGVRRSGGLASSARYGAQPNTSATALLLRRRGTAAASTTNRGAANRRRGAGSRSKRARTHSSTHHENNDDDNNNGSNIRVSSDAVTRMGLDVWSQADAHFVQDVAAQYFGRRGVQVEGKGVEVCGLKIC